MLSKIHLAQKLPLLTILLIFYLVYKPALVLFLPGLVLLPYINFKDRNFIESFFYTIVASLSFYICSFWLLKFLPISLSVFLEVTYILSLVIFLLRSDNGQNHRSFGWRDLVGFVVIFSSFFVFVSLFEGLLVPPGADMATHSYMARLITEKNGFPATYEPLLPAGNFGSSPIGLSVLMAIFAMTSGLPVFTSGLYLTAFVYLLFSAGVYVFVKRNFGIKSAVLTLLTIFWLDINIIHYAEWGGNSTVLSIAIAFFAMDLVAHFFKENSLGWKEASLLAMFLYAAFTAHFIIPVVIVYWILNHALLHPKETLIKPNIIFFTKMAFIGLLLAIPFLSVAKLPSGENIRYIMDWQRLSEFDRWEGVFRNAHYTVPLYIYRTHGTLSTVLLAIGIFFALKAKTKFSSQGVSALLATLIMVLNSRYWFLPLSPLLYPDRVVSTAIIPISFFIGVFYRQITERSDDAHLKISGGLILTVALLASVFFRLSQINYMRYRENFLNYSMVNNNDLTVLTWIGANIPESAMIQNNYGDAGIWIPAVAFRKVSVNDSNVLEREVSDKLKDQSYPDYLFVGDNIIYPNKYHINRDKLGDNTKYKMLFHSGEAQIFTITK